MDRLPIFLQLTGKSCLVVGGGIVATRKIRLLRRTGASIAVLAPVLTPELQQQVDAGDIGVVDGHYDDCQLSNYWLVVAATSDDALNRRVAADADSAGRFCNVVDDNDASTFILPAIVDRSPVIIAIGTEGNAPVLAQQLKQQIEAWIPERIGKLATQAGRWRALVRKRFNSMRERRRFWQDFFDGPIAQHLLAGRNTEAEKKMRALLLGTIEDNLPTAGEAWIVGAGPGDPGLVTLRAQQLIGRADVIVYDRLVSKTVLDFGRKEADYISVGKCAGNQAMSQTEINSLLVELVQSGKRVCRLKGGDPFVFGRGGEEAQALASAGLPFQIVPGISAAIACAAYAGIPVTLRGVSASVTLATATLDKESKPDFVRLLKAGDTLALYMGTSSVNDIRQQLLAGGVSGELPVAFVENGTTRDQRTVFSSVHAMQVAAQENRIQSPCIIFIGRSVAAAEELQWFEGQSRAGRFTQRIDGEFVAVASM